MDQLVKAVDAALHRMQNSHTKNAQKKTAAAEQGVHAHA